MNRETEGLLKITNTEVSQVDHLTDILGAHPSRFIRLVFRDMSDKQPTLYRYLHRAKCGLIFNLGSAMTFRIIPEDQRKLPLSSADIELLHQNLTDSTTSEKIHAENKKYSMDMTWLVEKLNEDSSEYMPWLWSIVRGIADEKRKSDFVKGSLITIMPFYTRLEAQRLDKKYQ